MQLTFHIPLMAYAKPDLHRAVALHAAVVDAATLFRDHGPFVARLLWQLGLPPQDIDDAVQDVFMVAHQKGGFTPGPAKATTWLAEIAVRLAHARRRKASRVTMELSDHLPSTGPDPSDDLDRQQRWQRVQTALDALDSDRRTVLVLADIHGESCEDIAKILMLPVGTVYSRLHRARRKFKKAYERTPLHAPRRP